MYGCNHLSSHHQLKAWQTGGVHVRTLASRVTGSRCRREAGRTNSEKQKPAEAGSCSGRAMCFSRREAGAVHADEVAEYVREGEWTLVDTTTHAVNPNSCGRWSHNPHIYGR